ncbi:NAD(P)H-binding protein [Parasphingorhabdus cellanae]|uniref:Divinyl chlorophyllide a 8-vinyl-reductase, chloroplastic n=1 Tax=Parasphingorhabdus cellanae TaxID=2806553 RepID=A0ABX7T793_9SPHN|nr:NAD(P)H-binding protein [Parasphingorhabdus cellanae]QTD57376.1 NAD(P)H-binding protein [Parasphingorhabdus cellanae]
MTMTSSLATKHTDTPKRILLLGATGTIGQATVNALLERGHAVVCFVRRTDAAVDLSVKFAGAEFRFGEVTDPNSLQREGFEDKKFDALVSCLASRSGAPKDAWRIDHDAHLAALAAAKSAGVSHMILLSAICVQKPLLSFQHAKLAFEEALIKSGLTYSIVRPTAFFKSLSGQIDRVRNGKPFLLFGDGNITSCKPISDRDLAHYIADCLEDKSKHDCILPIGGPGSAITPKQQGERLFALLGITPHFKHVPIKMLDLIIMILEILGKISPKAANKAELAKIGRYYATESMLLLDPETEQYNAAETPSTGSDRLFDFYARIIKDNAKVDRSDHAVF